MDSLGEILHLCRLCLVKDHVNIPIFDDPGNIRQIPLKISSCLPVQISRNDNLPKKICDGCSEKLDLCYEFWNSSAIAEKKLLSMVAEKKNQIVEPPVPQPILMKAELVPMDNITSEQVAEEENQSEPLVPQPIVVKQEAEVLDTFESSVERTEETEAPPSKRPRRSAAIKAQKNIVPESDDDDDDEGAATEDINSEEPLTKEEPYVDEDIHTEVPDMSVDDAQPGTSGLNQGMEDSTVILLSQCPKCPFCGARFLTELDLQIHEPTCLPSTDKICLECGLSFSHRRELTIHQNQKHQRKTEAKFKCSQCDKSYGKRWVLEGHMNKIHRGIVKIIRCDYPECAGKTFSSKSSFSNHKKLCHDQGRLEFSCEYCGKVFLHLSQVNNHIKLRHLETGEKIQCEESGCGKSFKSKSSLSYHVETKHVKDHDEFKCQQCDKTFPHRYLYKRHQRRHMNKKTYPCTICDKVLTSSESQQAHIRRHTGERPFECETCGKAFVSTQQLKIHQVVHTKERPHGCKLCEKKFSQRGSLTIHVKKCHPKEDS